MGQYHELVDLDRREFLHPHSMGDGLKLMEWGQSGCGTAMALALFLGPEGRWHGDRIAAVGDYGEPGDLPPAIEAEFGDAAAIYHACPSKRYAEQWDGPGQPFTDVSEEAGQLLVHAGAWAGMPEGAGWCRPALRPDYKPVGPDCVILDEDQGLVLDPAQFGDPRCIGAFAANYHGGALTALAVLLGCSNGRGGGDFHGPDPMNLVGSWAGHRIRIVPMDEIDPSFSVYVRSLLDAGGEGCYQVHPSGLVTRKVWDDDIIRPDLVIGGGA